ncbi:MAG TPA: hypothetical protein V6C57_25905 [Coleofasciculaceae cyanobacterium]
MNLTKSRVYSHQPYGSWSGTLSQSPTSQWQYPFIPSSSVRHQKKLPEKLFEIWQDLSLAATGSDTVWGYAIPLRQIVDQLDLTASNVTILLAQLEVPGYEYIANSQSITFHAPIA